jgi:hypothetical protein
MRVRTGGGPVHVRSSQRFPQIHPEGDPRFDVPRFSLGDARVFASRQPDCPRAMKGMPGALVSALGADTDSERRNE